MMFCLHAGVFRTSRDVAPHPLETLDSSVSAPLGTALGAPIAATVRHRYGHENGRWDSNPRKTPTIPADLDRTVAKRVCSVCGEPYINAGAHAEACRGPK